MVSEPDNDHVGYQRRQYRHLRCDVQIDIQAMITPLVAVGDVLLMTPVPGSGVTSTAHNQALYEVADTNDLPLLDLNDRWGSQATMNGYGAVLRRAAPQQGRVHRRCSDYRSGVGAGLAPSLPHNQSIPRAEFSVTKTF
jgi:hypothetical protein